MMHPRGARLSHARAMLAMACVIAASLGVDRVHAQEPTLQGHVSLSPSMVKVGEPVVYRGRVVLDQWLEARWLPPEDDPDVTWGALSPHRTAAVPAGSAATRASSGPKASSVSTTDTVTVEARIQVFRTGVIQIPGLRVEVRDPRRARVYRLPMVNLIVTSVLSAADSNADLKPLRGPLRAPWWERVPWLWVALSALALAAIVVAIVLMRRRVKPAVPIVPAVDPAAVALAALAALRGLNLPAHGRFAEHIYHLTRIMRQFMEATLRETKPGDTTPELVHHLETTPLDSGQVRMLRVLLDRWDQVKFARAPSSVEESRRAEDAVERLIRRASPEPVTAAKVA